MPSLELNVPALTATASAQQLASTQSWLDALPKLDENLAFDALLERLQELNRLATEPARRYALLGTLLDLVEHLVEALCRRCEHLEFPLGAAEQKQTAQVQRLIEETAIGYKRVVVDLCALGPNADAQALLRDALLQALRLLSWRVMQGYVVYQAAPPGVWGEMHRLYRYAERIDVATTRVEHLADQSVGDVYRRALLIALANPFHLMQGEVRLTYDKLAKWTLALRVRHPAEFPTEAPETFFAARYHVDLDGDAPPAFGLRGGQAAPADARVLELRPVVQIVEERVRQLVLKGQLAMREQLERDLLRRLRNAWSGRPARAAERVDQQRTLQVVSSLRACHYFLSGGDAFEPERQEIALHGDAFNKAPSLSLVPLDEEPWRRDDTRGKLEHGVLKPRGYQFDVERHDADVWERAERGGVARTTQLEDRQDSKLQARSGTLQLHDISATGLGVRFAGDGTLRFRVGDLVRIVDEANLDQPDTLATVCWLRHTAAGQLALGFNRIGGRVRAVAVRGIAGSGEGGDYHRALELRSGEPLRGESRSLIVPAGSYDLGSVVLCNTGDAYELLALRRILRATKGFTQYAVDVQPVESTWLERVMQSLYQMLERASL